jgi:hypothetical protein
VVKEEHYLALVNTLKLHDYPVLSGVCNFDVAHPNVMAICKDGLPNIIRGEKRHYNYYDLRQEGAQQEGIIQVKFSGMPFLFMRRDIVEQVPLRGDTVHDPTRKHIEPKSFDLGFCYECERRNIPVRVDLGVRMLHLAGCCEDIKVNKEKPGVYYEDGEGNTIDLTNEYLSYIYEINPYNARERLKKIVPF